MASELSIIYKMNSIFQFLYKHLHWLVFVVLEIVCFVLLFSFNGFQGSIYLSTANAVSARLMVGKSRVASYFALDQTNEALAVQNAMLQQRVTELEQMLGQFRLDSLSEAEAIDKVRRMGFRITPVRIVDNSINKTDNFITIDKGSADGLVPDMGVIDCAGTLGVVYKCSQHYSLVMPLLNSKSSLSCKVLGGDSFGFLKWEGGDARYAMLYDLPRYAEVQIGDTIVTSGHSVSFPEGIMVGRVAEMFPSSDGLYVTLKVLLSAGFDQLGHAFVVSKMDADELVALKEELNPKKVKKGKK